MKRILLVCFLASAFFSQKSFAQIPIPTLVKIVRAEDERRFDATLENLLKSPSAKIRQRAALAAGRIGDEKAISALSELVNDASPAVRNMAIFALGEIESLKGIKEVLLQTGDVRKGNLRARSLEAVGKIVAANPKETSGVEMGKFLLEVLKAENARRSKANEEIILAGITAVLRARPEGGDKIVGEFLNHENPRIRADALNTLARLRSKNFNETARRLLQTDQNPIVRANAARLLGAGEDKTAVDLILNAATKDADSRVRVSAIRSLGSLKNALVADTLLQYGEKLLADYKKAKAKDTLIIPSVENELLTLVSALGMILKNSDNERAIRFVSEFFELNDYQSGEISQAFALISPKTYLEQGIKVSFTSTSASYSKKSLRRVEWKTLSSATQGVSEIIGSEDEDAKQSVESFLSQNLDYKNAFAKDFEESSILPAIPALLTAYSKLKSENLSEISRSFLRHRDVFVRAAAAQILSEQNVTSENTEALKSAFSQSLLTDKHDNDAQLAILDAIFKLDKKASFEALKKALDAPDYLVRKKAFELLKQFDAKEFPDAANVIKTAEAQGKNRVLAYSEKTQTKLGQVLNSQADYVRAVSRKNGTVKAVLTTEKGIFTIDFFPEDAPLAVDNFVKLARAKFFDGLEVHRVVPNFVMQDGDPRGDGNGSPGWSIRCEINMLPYERGAVGMALSGKDTGGSQWFVTHSPQPHLDGGYTVFGRVSETDMRVVDDIVRGDKILSVKIFENDVPRRKIRVR